MEKLGKGIKRFKLLQEALKKGVKLLGEAKKRFKKVKLLGEAKKGSSFLEKLKKVQKGQAPSRKGLGQDMWPIDQKQWPADQAQCRQSINSADRPKPMAGGKETRPVASSHGW